ncbi:MAG: hypothetical protein JST50_12415 [Bacteroidetes bacterium]|jgi:hypothetical protein|nr:hypothetical protein [Bacteroidota bacterium]
MMKLTRFWFEFDKDNRPMSVGLGCGVTGWSYDDAINILKQTIFKDIPFPQIKNVDENVDVSTLDKGHVLPNMLPPSERGIWYPIGYAFW